jgi:hypothetical protein
MPEFDNAHVEAAPEKARVAVVGGGIAGLTCALRLAQCGCDVTIYEAADRIGGNTSSAGDAGAYQDVYPHIFPDWYANFWQLFEQDLGFRREEHFSPRSGVKVLDKPTGDPSPDQAPKYMDMALAPTWKSVVTNMRSDVLSIPDFFLFAFLNLDLAAQPPDPNNIDMLSRLDVNGYFYSRAYSTEATAALQDYTISVIWSLPSDLTSAMAYRKFIKHQLSSFGPYAWMLKGSLQAKLIGPLERKLTGNSGPGEHDCVIKTGKKVHSVEVLEDGVPRITIETPSAGGGDGQVAREEAAPVDYVVLAVPGAELARLVMEGAPGRRLVDKIPALAQLGRLNAAAIPVVNLYFKRKLPFFVPQEIIGLRGSEYDLSVLDISQLWDGSEKIPDVTVLVLAASDVHAIPSKDLHEQGYLMIKRLSEYLSFDPGRAWGESRDIDWQKTAVRQNTDHLLFVNDVGSRRWRPLADYSDPPHGLRCVFFAGDVCQTDVDMATIEAAVQSGAMAARALQKVEMGKHGKRRMAAVPIKMAPHKVFTDATLLAAKLALLPFAYGAAAWSAARGVANGSDVETAAYSPSKYVMLLPYQYVTDWWKTAYWLARGLSGPIEGVDPADMPIGFGRRDIPPTSEGPDADGERSEGAGLVGALVDLGASALGALGDVLQEISASHRSRAETAAGHQPASPFTGFVVQALQAMQAAYEGNDRRSDTGAADQRPYQRRWRVKE